MWVKSELGKLHNLTYAETVEIEDRDNGLVVIVRFSDSEGRTADLTEVKESEVQPHAVIKRIHTSLQDGDRVLDLERSASAVRRPM